MFCCEQNPGLPAFLCWSLEDVIVLSPVVWFLRGPGQGLVLISGSDASLPCPQDAVFLAGLRRLGIPCQFGFPRVGSWF